MDKKKKSFCINCRKETCYTLRKVINKYTIKDKDYEFFVTEAVCRECGEKMSIPGIIDMNIQEVDSQYRNTEHIVTIDKIKKMMSIYNMGKAPMSLALGFGEVTITRYLDGQVPSKEYSDVMANALESHEYMETMINKNRSKIGETAYKKAKKAIAELREIFGVSDVMIRVISYVFKKVEEITPLALQKILYFIQGIYSATYDEFLFEENCEAWVHGPVYRNVYFLFKDFKYNPIDDNRFVFLEDKFNDLNNKEKGTIDLVIDTFGKYSGKILEKITHKEEPWLKAREGYLEDEISDEEISSDVIKKYFKDISKKYDITSKEGLNSYIEMMIS